MREALSKQLDSLKNIFIIGLFIRSYPVYKISIEKIKYSADYDFKGCSNFGYLDHYPELNNGSLISHGDWADKLPLLTDTIRFKSFEEALISNKDWSNTLYSDYIKQGKISKGNWNSMDSDTVFDYYKNFFLEKRNSECINTANNPINVFITDKGEIAVRDGNHRAIIGILNDCKYIYIKVVNRHVNWINEIKKKTFFHANNVEYKKLKG